MNDGKQRVAVVGGGIAGLAAGYYLSRRHEVSLFEKSGRLGGNAYSYRTPAGDFLDVAAAAFGKAGYKNFYALLDELEIPTEPCPTSYLSFHNLDTGEGLYLTPSVEGALCQGLKLLRPANLASLARLFLGLKRAQLRRSRGRLSGETLGGCLEGLPEFSGDAEIAFLSALSLLSSMEIHELLASPADFFLDKLRTHHDVISPKAFYSVRCVRGGTRRYVNSLAAPYRKRIRFNASIAAIERGAGGGTTLVLEDGSREAFEAVVMACNPDQALALLARPTALEQELLGAWRYKEGRVVVHRDHSSFPPRPLIGAYTFLYTLRAGTMRTSVNGALWHEPQAPKDCDFISAQHPNYPIRPDLIALDTRLRTPLFDFASCATIPLLPRLNDGGPVYYCGSYFGHGLHEDAVASAKQVARRLYCL
ncbi:MAG: FAD-dependent oxidoreductase [Elusimicrobia bacterium]|nr:FAD-dependent oxidoreductase [Elusimicrobiota bacterium]